MAIKMVGRVSTRTRAAAAGEREKKERKEERNEKKRREEKKKVREEREKRVERNDTVNAAPTNESTSCFSSRRVVPSAEDRLSWFTK